MTGAALGHRLRMAAKAANTPLADFLRPLWPRDALGYLRQLEGSEMPRATTVARVEALLAGKRVPPPPITRDPARAAPPVHYSPGTRAPNSHPQPVTRDPCPRCGIRADIGCKHQRPE